MNNRIFFKIYSGGSITILTASACELHVCSTVWAVEGYLPWLGVRSTREWYL